MKAIRQTYQPVTIFILAGALLLSFFAIAVVPALPAHAQTIDSVQACSDQNAVYVQFSVPDINEYAIGVFVDGTLADVIDVQAPDGTFPYTFNSVSNVALEEGDVVKVVLSMDDNLSLYISPYYSEFLTAISVTAEVCGGVDAAAAWLADIRALPLTLVGGPFMHDGVLLISGFVVRSGVERGYWSNGAYVVLGWCDESGCVAVEGGPLTNEQLEILEMACNW